MMSRCLYCYQELGEGETDFHPQCGKKIFGSKTVPLLPYTKADIKQLAEQVIRSQTTLTGVQAKSVSRYIIVPQPTATLYYRWFMGTLYSQTANGTI